MERLNEFNNGGPPVLASTNRSPGSTSSPNGAVPESVEGQQRERTERPELFELQ